MNTRKHHRQAGFTLIELLLVLVILSVLAAVVVPKLTSRSEQARVTAAQQDVSAIDSALDIFETDNGRYPSSEEGLAALVNAPANIQQTWHGPYLKKGVPVDPWKNQYIYKFPGSHNVNGPDVYSLGPDGKEGNDDLVNWQTN